MVRSFVLVSTGVLAAARLPTSVDTRKWEVYGNDPTPSKDIQCTGKPKSVFKQVIGTCYKQDFGGGGSGHCYHSSSLTWENGKVIRRDWGAGTGAMYPCKEDGDCSGTPEKVGTGYVPDSTCKVTVGKSEHKHKGRFVYDMYQTVLGYENATVPEVQSNVTFPIPIKVDKCGICKGVADKLVKAGGSECGKVCASAVGPLGLVVCGPLCDQVKKGLDKASVCKAAHLCSKVEEEAVIV